MSDLAVHIAIVSLLQDLELLLSSYHRIFRPDSYCLRPFDKHDIQNLYSNLSSIDSLLRDEPSGGFRDAQIIEKFGDKIVKELHIVANYIELELCNFYEWDRKFGLFIESHPDVEISLKKKSNCEGVARSNKLHEIEAEMVGIIQLLDSQKKEVLGEAPTDLDGTSSTGKSNSSSYLKSFSSLKSRTKDDKLVGHQKDFDVMLNRLTGQSSKLEVFSVIGMAGIGKTTFTKRLYEHQFVTYHFHVRAWVTLSQKYREREILLGILHCIDTDKREQIYEQSNKHYLREQVKNSLRGKRYLIVLDDMWEQEAWNDLRMSFPDDKNGSRVLLTSRLRDVAQYASRNNSPHGLPFLSSDESWELLCSKIFGNESCPQEFVKIGMCIAEKCQGLPLAVVLVGGLLSSMDVKQWETVAQQVGSLVMNRSEDSEQCQDILALSYNHLPCHLKACFLFLGIFPEDYDIPVRKLMRLWVAEGFIRPSENKSLEEVAEGYLNDLIARSLVLVKRKRNGGRTKICGIHDLMRDLCFRECQKGNFLRVIKTYGQVPQIDELEMHLKIENYRSNPLAEHYNLRRLSFHSSMLKYMQSEISFGPTRSFFCFETLRSTDLKDCLTMEFTLLKVLDMQHVQLSMIPLRMLSFIHLRYVTLAVQNFADIVKLLPKFHNLQTLICDCSWDGHLSTKFWDMHELRHVHIYEKSYWPNLSRETEISSSSESSFNVVPIKNKLRALDNLQSLSKIRPSSCTVAVFRSMPNLKYLGVRETEEDYQFRGWFKNLFYLQELEILKYIFSNPFVRFKQV